MTKKISVIFLIFISALELVSLTSCDSPKPKAVGPLEDLTVGTYSGDLSALFWIAKDRGYFSENGLNVQFKLRESGLKSYMDLLEGKADLATITEFVFASHVLERPDLRILAVVGQTNNLKLVARKDHGVTQITDLRSKRIGLVRESIAEYCLHLFLMSQHIPYQDNQVVDLPPSEQVQALIRGDIDAALVWEPFARQMKNELGKTAVSWPAQSGQDFYWLLVGTDDTLKKRSSAVRGVIAALAAAEDFMKHQPNEAKTIVASQVGSNHMPELWETSRFDLSLSRPVVLIMESQLRWMNSGKGVQEFKMPDLLEFIYFDALNSVKPEKIKILH